MLLLLLLQIIKHIDINECILLLIAIINTKYKYVIIDDYNVNTTPPHINMGDNCGVTPQRILFTFVRWICIIKMDNGVTPCFFLQPLSG